MASRLTVLRERVFGNSSGRKAKVVSTICALLGLALAGELGLAQSNSSQPPVISTSTQWTLDAPVLASSSASGVPSNGFSMQGGFSPDGTHLLFWSRSTNISPAATSGFSELYLKDLTTGQVSVVSADANGVEGNNDSTNPNNSSQILMFSPDGTQVAFVSTSSNLAAGATNTHSQIYVKNLQSGAITVESADANGNEANNDSLYPMFSPDGSKLAFNSISTNLVPNVPSFNSEVYVKDLALGAITLVSADANGVPANGNSTQLGAFSPDSTKIAFQSTSTNLMSGANGASQVFVKDLLTGSVTPASSNAAGVLANGNSVMPAFSPNHLALAFQSSSTNLGVNSFTSQIYVRSIFTASGAVVDSAFAAGLSTAGQLAFSDSDANDTHTATVTAQASDLGAVTASVPKDSTGSGTGGVVRWNYQVDESQLHGLTAPATDNFTLTLTDSQGCIATTAIVVTALPQDFAVTNTTSGSTPTS